MSDNIEHPNGIARLRVARGWSRKDLAELMNTSPQQIERLEKGQRKLSQDWIERAAKALEVDSAAVLTSSADATDYNAKYPASDGDVVQIQKLDLSLSMGPGTLIDDWVEWEPVSFDASFIRSLTRTPATRLKLVSGIGDSMFPTLSWGDLIMIDTTARQLARQDGIYWINLYGAAGIKRLRAVGPGRVLVKSDNPDVEDQEVSTDDLRIEGRAIWVARGL